MSTSAIFKHGLVILLVWFYDLTGIAQPSAISLFRSETPKQVILTTDMKALLKSKYAEAYQPAMLHVIDANSDTIALSVEIRCRGNMRKETCYYPSIRMKFPKTDFSYNKLKWVNVCDGEEDDEFLLKEYLAYKLLNAITDKSFDVCLVKMQYVDSIKEKGFASYAFVMQSAEELASKFDGRVIEPKHVKEEILNPEELAIFTFFQYMIGNTDWAIPNLHNVEFFTHPASNAVIPVAYDFDYSGFVNAPYAAPHPTMPISHVTTRHNKGVCIDEPTCEKTRLLFLEKKEQILKTCRDFDLLDQKNRTRTLNYLEDFFKTIEDQKVTTRIFTKDCTSM